MKFNVSSKTLYNYVSSVSKVINAKNPMPILNNFLFTLEGDQLTIKASDMENALVGRLMVSNSEGAGSFCLEAHKIVELLSKVPDQGLTFDINDDNLEVTISYNNGSSKTVAINGAEYPQRKEEQTATNVEFVCSAEEIIKGIDYTLFAVGTDQIRPQLMGILWDVKADSLTFVSTDTRKLVKYTNSAIKPGVECSFILPVKGATVIKNVFAKEEEIKVTVSPTGVVFESASFTFDCRLIKGNFPDYNRVIPKNNPFSVTIDRQSLLSAVRRVAVSGDAGGGLVKFKFSSNTVTLRAVDNSYGRSGWEEVPCNYSGNDLLIGLASEFFINILSTFTSDEITIYLADPSHPILCVPTEEPIDTKLEMILMPMDMRD